MTNLEWLNKLDINELSTFLSEITENEDNAPWNKWFASEFCNQCPPVEIETVRFGKELFCMCEIREYCPKFYELTNIKADTPNETDIIKLWMEEEHD